MNGAVRPHIPKMEKIISEVKNAADIFDCDLRNIKIPRQNRLFISIEQCRVEFLGRKKKEIVRFTLLPRLPDRSRTNLVTSGQTAFT